MQYPTGARTIRKKIHDKLDEFLTEFPPVIKHPYASTVKSKVYKTEDVTTNKIE